MLEYLTNIRVAIVLVTAFSLLVLSETRGENYPVIGLPPVRGNLQACDFNTPICSEYWYPSGPSVDKFGGVIYQDPGSEYLAITSANPPIDFMDLAVLAPDAATLTESPNFGITSLIETNFYSLEFNMANSFWGVNFDFGNNPKGTEIRQGITHMIDRQAFASSSRPGCGNNCVAIDNPELLGSGLLTPNPCAWDSSFPESGSNCQVGGIGGTAYRLGSAAGANGISYLQAPGSVDLNAAAAHFVAAGIASGCDGGTGTSSCISSSDSILSGISSAAKSNVPQIFINTYDLTSLEYGDDLASQICYLFTGSYSPVPCSELTVIYGPASAFPGFTTPSSGSPTPNWWMFTQGNGSPTVTGAVGNEDSIHRPEATDICPNSCGDPFDDTLYYTYNSRFVDGLSSIQIPNGGHCSGSSVPTQAAPDYQWLCNKPFDSISSQMEFAPCVNTSGDPVHGSVNNNSTGTCQGTTQLSTTGGGIEAEDAFGRGAYSIPIVSKSTQSGYLGGWKRVSNAVGTGAPNFFTWLNAWTPNPRASGGLLEQAVGSITTSVNPYIASSAQDLMIVGNVYDSLIIADPVNEAGLIDWMALSVQQIPNSQLTYMAPAGTYQSFRFTLRSDLSFQDGRKVTSFDVAFSYLSMIGAGSTLSSRATGMTGITLLGPTQFDIGVGRSGIDYGTVGALPILPGRYWTADQGAYDREVSTCTAIGAACYPAQYTIHSATPLDPNCALNCTFPAAALNLDPTKITPSSDPISGQTLIGSGPWECGPIINSKSSTGCSSSGAQNPPLGGSYILLRFGQGFAPGSSISGIYFRSSGNLALYLWSQDTGDITHDFLNFSVVASCFGAAVTSTGPCSHFQQGIGANGGPVSVGLSQVAIVNRFVGLNWVAPFNWATNPPTGIGGLNPILYEGTNILNPASTAGCTTAYPKGGYDC